MKKLFFASALVLMTSLANAAVPFNAKAAQAAQERFKYQYGTNLVNMPANVNTPGAVASLNGKRSPTYYVPTPSYMVPKVVVKPQDFQANMAKGGTYTPEVYKPRVDPGREVPPASVLAKQQANKQALANAYQQQQFKAMNIAPAPINNRQQSVTQAARR
jgi:hypothetical protein